MMRQGSLSVLAMMAALVLAVTGTCWSQGEVVLARVGPAGDVQDGRVTLQVTLSKGSAGKPINLYRSCEPEQDEEWVCQVTSPHNTVAVVQPPGSWWYTARVGAGESSVPSARLCVTTGVVANGLAVGSAKIYDERCLQAQIQDVIRILGRSAFPDPTALFGSAGGFQGGVATASATAASATTVPTPKVVTGYKTVGIEGKREVEGEKPETTTVDRTTTINTSDITRESIAAAAPALPSQISQYAAQPTFGLSPGDLLQRQTELEYQLTILRMLLERSLTDRLVQADTEGKTWLPRSQPVLGFDVSIDPLPQYRNAVAEVEVTISSAGRPPQTTDNAGSAGDKPGTTDKATDSADMTGEGPLLVAMMPQSKTYNVASYSQKAQSFGLGVVAGVFNIGGASARAQQKMYLIKDIDTVALQRAADLRGPRGVRFAWQFRPVLGQPYVQPGVRSVFAIIGLPAGSAATWTGRVQVRTCWRRLGRDGISVGPVIAGSESLQKTRKLTVSPSFGQQHDLQAVQSLLVEDAGGGNVCVAVLGDFDPSSYINLGKRQIACAADGLLAAGSGRIKFTVPAEELFRNAPVILDRYGTAVRVHVEPANEKRLEIASGPTVRRLDGTNSLVTFTLKIDNDAEQPAGTGPYNCTALCQHQEAPVRTPPAETQPNTTQYLSHFPLVCIGGQVFGLSNSPFTFEGGQPKPAAPTTVSFVAPTALLAQSRTMVVQDLLWGPAYRAECDLPPLTTVSKASILSKSPRSVTLQLTGTNLDKATVGTIGFAAKSEGYSPSAAEQIVTVQATTGDLPDDLLLLLTPRDPAAGDNPVTVSVSLDPPKPSGMPLMLSMGDSCGASLTISSAVPVAAVVLDDMALPITGQETADGQTKVSVSIPAAATAKRGTKVPVVVYADGKRKQDAKVFSFVVR